MQWTIKFNQSFRPHATWWWWCSMI